MQVRDWLDVEDTAAHPSSLMAANAQAQTSTGESIMAREPITADAYSC
jgi:hypothetical protein